MFLSKKTYVMADTNLTNISGSTTKGRFIRTPNEQIVLEIQSRYKANLRAYGGLLSKLCVQ
jgi:hypothetical protein